MIGHRVFLGLLFAEAAVLAALFSHGRSEARRWERSGLPAQQAIVARLSLTDLSVWTEARYTRHPSQADRFAPFQDLPGAPEHFPAGSVLAPDRLRFETP